MGFRNIAINEKDFSDKELDAIETLASKRQLSDVTSIAIKEYLNKINPEVMKEQNIAIIRTEADIQSLLDKERASNVKISDYQAKLFIDMMKEELKKGAFRIDAKSQIIRDVE